jgi:hypothetical protein
MCRRAPFTVFQHLRKTRQEIPMNPTLASTVDATRTNHNTELSAACSLISVMLVYMLFGVAGYYAAAFI